MSATTLSKTPKTRNQAAMPAAASWCVGIVSQADGDGFVVSSGSARTLALRAVSCLLEPEPGDSVACLRAPGQALWIMAVLSRASNAPQRIRLQGDARIEVTEGALQFKADSLELQGHQFQLCADEAKMAVGTGDVVGRHLRITGTVLKLVGSVLSTVADRVNHFSRHHVRTTEGIDRVSATHVECEARQLLRLSGEHALVNGEKLVKARGAQIHFG
jgi:hypothetical protein